MSGGKDTEAQNGVRTFLKEQAELPGDVHVTVTRFDDTIETLGLDLPSSTVLNEVERYLTIEPRGMTALFDAVGKTVLDVGAHLAKQQEHERPGRVVVLVATDGLENASGRYSSSTLKTLIEQQETTYGWEFIFMGTSQEALLQAQSAGFRFEKSYASSDSAMGVRSAYAVAGQTVSRARTTNSAVQVTDEDRKDLQ